LYARFSTTNTSKGVAKLKPITTVREDKEDSSDTDPELFDKPKEEPEDE